MPYRFLVLLLRLIRFPQFKCRQLTVGEIQMCRSVFGDRIDYGKAHVMNHPFLPWQPKHILMAPNGYIHVRNALFKDDYSKETASYRAVFIHEMTHIFQHQHGINVVLRGAILQTAYFLSFGRYNPYQYSYIPGKSFWTYNIEQQGDIARDIYLQKLPNIIQETD